MKRFLLTLTMLLFAGLTAVPAFATVEIKVTDGINTYFVAGNVLFFSDADFSLLIQTATSNGPAGPAVLTYSSTITSLAGGSLKIEVSDTGFALPVGPANLIQTLNTNTPVATTTATGTLSGVGYYGTGAGNVFFCEETAVCTNATPAASFTSFVVGNSATNSVPVSFVAPFSLDAVLNASFTSSGNALFTGTLSAITSVPEPASVLFLGTSLLVVTAIFRKKLQSRRA